MKHLSAQTGTGERYGNIPVAMFKHFLTSQIHQNYAMEFPISELYSSKFVVPSLFLSSPKSLKSISVMHGLPDVT